MRKPFSVNVLLALAIVACIAILFVPMTFGYYDFSSLRYMAIGIVGYFAIKKISDIKSERRAIIVRCTEETPKIVNLDTGPVIASIKELQASQKTIIKGLPLEISALKSAMLTKLGNINGIDEEIDYVVDELERRGLLRRFGNLVSLEGEPSRDFLSKMIYEKAMKEGSFSMKNSKKQILEGNLVFSSDSISMSALKKIGKSKGNSLVLAFGSDKFKELEYKKRVFSPGNALLLYLEKTSRIRCDDAGSYL